MTTFVRVVESGSFTAAAAQLGVSVSAVAKAVSRLEEELETQLLVRSTRKLAPNDEGRAFYARCQQILNDIEDAEASVKSARRSPKGRSEEHTSELQSQSNLVCRLLLEKKKNYKVADYSASNAEVVLLTNSLAIS